MAVKVDVKEIVSNIKDDRKFLRLKKIFSTHETYKLSTDKLLEEIKSCHQIRKVRRLNVTDTNFVDNLIDASLLDQAQRSRLTEILIQCVRAQTSLEQALESLKFHLLTTFSSSLTSFRTKEERQQVIQLALKEFSRFLADVDIVKQAATLVITDIDKASYALKNSITAIQLHHAAKERYS